MKRYWNQTASRSGSFRIAVLTFFLLLPMLSGTLFAAETTPASVKAKRIDTLCIWRVTHPEKPGILYLTGAIHFGLPEMYPLSLRYDEILLNSDYLTLEVLDIEKGGEAMNELIRKHAGWKKGEKPVFTEKELRTLQRRYSVNPNSAFLPVLKNFRPWFLSLFLESLYVTQSGMKEFLGSEKIFSALAAERKMPKRELESLQQQMDLLISPEMNKAALVDLRGALSIPSDKEFIAKKLHEFNLLLRWVQRGDAAAGAALFEDKDQNPLYYEIMILKRNQKMAERLMRTLDRKETGVILLGAAHFAGADSINEFMKQSGCRVEQLTELPDRQNGILSAIGAINRYGAGFFKKVERFDAEKGVWRTLTAEELHAFFQGLQLSGESISADEEKAFANRPLIRYRFETKGARHFELGFHDGDCFYLLAFSGKDAGDDAFRAPEKRSGGYRMKRIKEQN